MKTGLVSISFRKLTPEKIVQLCRESGLGAIEWGGDIHVPAGDLETARRVGELTRKSGLEVACYGSYCHMTAEEQDTLPVITETAQALGAPLIRVWAGEHGSASAAPSEREDVTANTRYLSELAGRCGMGAAFEYHGNTLTDDADSALRLLRDIDCENIGCLWQPPIGMSTDGCLSSIDKVSRYIRNIHTFTWAGDPPLRLPLAEGAEKWSRLIERIEHLPGERAMLLEFVRDDDPAQLVKDARTLKEWLKEG